MRRLALAALRFWQLAVSPSLGRHCRYYPSCSRYAAEAISTHGMFHGTRLGLWRLLRCNPWSRGGVDPVPPLPKSQVLRALSPRLSGTVAPALTKARSWIRS